MVPIAKSDKNRARKTVFLIDFIIVDRSLDKFIKKYLDKIQIQYKYSVSLKCRFFR